MMLGLVGNYGADGSKRFMIPGIVENLYPGFEMSQYDIFRCRGACHYAMST